MTWTFKKCLWSIEGGMKLSKLAITFPRCMFELCVTTILKAMENQTPWWDFAGLKNGGHQV